MKREPLATSADCLLVFVDDTGNETFKGDQAYFGLGGIAVLAAENEIVLKPRWKALRNEIRGSEYLPLHAADLGRTKNAVHLAAAGKFFADNCFLRFGVGTAADAKIKAPLMKRQPVYEMAKKYVAQAAASSKCRSVALIFESSQRADATLKREFGELRVFRGNEEIPVEHCLMPKSSNEPGLEVADFVANATGSMVRRLAQKRRDFPADFCAIFHNVPDSITPFMFIEEVIGGEPTELAFGYELRSAAR